MAGDINPEEGVSIVEGWTDPVPLRLETDQVGLVGTGFDLAVVMRDRKGRVVSLADYDWLVEASGTITFDPTGLLHALEPYKLRAWVTDDNGKTVAFPDEEPFEIRVQAP